MRKFILIVWAALSLAACTKGDPVNRSTELTVQVSVNDDPNPPVCVVHVWDASANTFPETLDLLDGLMFGVAEDIKGGKVDAVYTGGMEQETYPDGHRDNVRTTTLNIDEILSYDREAESGKILVFIGMTETSKYTYRIFEWRRGDKLAAAKVFNGKRPFFGYEEW